VYWRGLREVSIQGSCQGQNLDLELKSRYHPLTYVVELH